MEQIALGMLGLTVAYLIFLALTVAYLAMDLKERKQWYADKKAGLRMLFAPLKALWRKKEESTGMGKRTHKLKMN